MKSKEKVLTKHGQSIEIRQDQNIKNAMGEYAMIIAVDFRDWCMQNQIPYVRNGYQDLSTEELFDIYNNLNR